MDTSKSKKMKHRIAQFLLRISCSRKQLSRNRKPDSNQNPMRPIIQITIDCSGRRSVDATPPISKSTRKKERRLTETGLLYQTGAHEGRICPPVSPSSPRHYLIDSFSKSERKGKEITKNLICNGLSSSSSDNENEVEFFCSDKEKRELISSRSFSFSSDSSEFYRRQKNLPSFGKNEDVQEEEEEEESGFAVVKQSVDPYEDFKSSMKEMILENRINDSEEMRSLLEAYLELNSSEHHPIIVAAFADVWESIFPKT